MNLTKPSPFHLHKSGKHLHKMETVIHKMEKSSPTIKKNTVFVEMVGVKWRCNGDRMEKGNQVFAHVMEIVEILL